MKFTELEKLDSEIEKELTLVYETFPYHHPFLDPDILGPIVNNSFSPYFFNSKPVLYLISSDTSTSVEGYLFSRVSKLYHVLKVIEVTYPFVMKSEALLSEVIKRLCDVDYSMIRIIPLLDNPFIQAIENSVCNLGKKPLLRVVSYNLHQDKTAKYRVKKAQSHGLTYTILTGNELKRSIIYDFLKCAAESLKRRGRRIDINDVLVDRWYKTLKSISEKDKGAFIAVYSKNGHLVGGAYVLTDEKILFHYIAYNSIEGLRMNSGYLALDAAYKIAQDKHLTVDFGLNPLNDPFVEYKKHWGEYRIEYSYERISNFYKLLINAYNYAKIVIKKINKH